jgi:hypothetical protein
VWTALNFDPTTKANTNGDNATGTWGISITGNAATASAAEVGSALRNDIDTAFVGPTSFGAIGTHALMYIVNNIPTYNEGDLAPGSNLLYASFGVASGTTTAITTGSSPSGTWRVMAPTLGGSVDSLALFLRVA